MREYHSSNPSRDIFELTFYKSEAILCQIKFSCLVHIQLFYDLDPFSVSNFLFLLLFSYELSFSYLSILHFCCFIFYTIILIQHLPVNLYYSFKYENQWLVCCVTISNAHLPRIHQSISLMELLSFIILK